jgi:hypothetical protein
LVDESASFGASPLGRSDHFARGDTDMAILGGLILLLLAFTGIVTAVARSIRFTWNAFFVDLPRRRYGPAIGVAVGAAIWVYLLSR